MDENQDNTNWTPSSDDNLLNITDKNLINEYEAKGIATAEIFVLNLDENVKISAPLMLELHRVAFGELYDWAGEWRSIKVMVGQLIPPAPENISNLISQFIDNLNFKIAITKTEDDLIETLTYAHYEFVKIHPFNNGNGRTGRLLMNLVALQFGRTPLNLYQRQGDTRRIYINAMQQADKGNFESLKNLIKAELTFL